MCGSAVSNFIVSGYADGYDEISQGDCPALLQTFGVSCLPLSPEVFTIVSCLNDRPCTNGKCGHNKLLLIMYVTNYVQFTVQNFVEITQC